MAMLYNLANYSSNIRSKATQINRKLVWPQLYLKMMTIGIWEFTGIGWTFIWSNVTKVIQGWHEFFLHHQLINTPKINRWYILISPNLSSWQTPNNFLSHSRHCQAGHTARLSFPPQISVKDSIWAEEVGA